MYDTTPFIDLEERAPGFHDVSCKVTWTPRHDPASARTVVGDYLDADAPGGVVTLGCGIEMCLFELEVGRLDLEHLLAICRLVDQQLARQPWAELTCPEGTARIDLVPRIR